MRRKAIILSTDGFGNYGQQRLNKGDIVWVTRSHPESRIWRSSVAGTAGVQGGAYELIPSPKEEGEE